VRSINTLLAVAALALSATQLSCSVNDYCLNCGTGDGGMGSGTEDANDGGGEIDAPPDAGCVPTGTEICDAIDNDCNGLVDDGVLPEVDDPCANQDGVCAGGTKICTATAPFIKCTKNPSPEVCDFQDNNCNGMVDEGDPGGGGKCGTDQGECIAGTLRCQSAAGCDPSVTCDPLVTGNCCVKCTGFIDRRLDPELCNGKDDNCNSSLDEGLTNLGACTWLGATNNGACNIGTLSCVGAVPVCSGAVFPTFEVCNNIDDDCNNSTDEIFNKLTDPTNCGVCGNVCGAKSKTCTGGTNARLTCTVAGDCPGGTCDVNSQPRCASNGATPPVGTCGFQCNVGYINLDNQAANGCEYKCSPTGTEECDGIDNDCDGLTDELLTAPSNFCLTQGVCTNSVAVCTAADGWQCNYELPTFQLPYEEIEETCDGLNNDCDANTDESQPNLNEACSEVPETTCTGAVDEDLDGRVNDGCAQVGATGETGAQCANAINDDPGDDSVVNDGCPAIAENGVCKSAGTYQCNPGNLTGPARCVITQPGIAASPEQCDAVVDNGASTGSLIGQSWITLGGGKQIMQYEASRPDATSTDIGSKQTTVCSREDVQPWTNVKYPEAVAACASIGARLCTESEWHHACSVVAITAAPSVGTGAAGFVEAEDYSSIAFATGGTPNTARSWVPDYTTGFSGISAMEATPNSTNGGVGAIGNALTQSPRMSWLLNFTANSATYHIWVKAYQTGLLNNNNDLFVGLSANTTVAAPTATVTLPAATSCTVDANCTALTGGTCVDSDGNGSNDKCAGWQWVDAGTFNVTGSPVSRLASVFMGDDGVKIDKIAINTSGTAPTDTDLGEGGIWAYSANTNTYAAATCNGADRVAGDNDPVLATKSLPQCFANTGTGIFDMSGNVKE
jgi:Putative metal-binding motif